MHVFTFSNTNIIATSRPFTIKFYQSTKTVEVGWLNYCHQKGAHKQVRIQCGGGTRVIPFEKQDTAAYVLEKAYFFRMENLKKDQNYEFGVCDFQEQN